MHVPDRIALLATVSDAEAALVIAPVELNTRLSAVLVPESVAALSCAIETAPPELNVVVPKLTKSLAWLPSVIAVPDRLALPVTVTEVDAAFVIALDEVSDRLPAVLVPASCVAESSVTLTAPVVLKVSEPKFALPVVGTLIA